MLSHNLLRSVPITKAAPIFCACWNKGNINGFNFKRYAWSAVDLNRDPRELRSTWPKPSFDIDKMTAVIDHDNHDMRNELRQFLSDPVMRPRYNISLEDEREVRYNISLLGELEIKSISE